MKNLVHLAFILSLSGCSGAGPEEAVGRAVFEILLGPANVKCVVIQVVGTSTVTRQFNLAPQTSTVFNLTGLPLGAATFTARAFSVVCSQVANNTAPSFISDPVVATVSADAPVSATIQMREAGAAGGGTVGLNFP